MRVFACIVLFLISLIAALIAYLPLSFVADMANLKSKGVYYNHAVGTIWKGGFSDVHIGGEAVGQLNIDIRPLSFLKLKPTANVEFSGAVGNGKADVFLGLDKTVEVKNLLANIQLNAFKHLDVQLRRSPSKLNLAVTSLKVSAEGRCLAADGRLNSDMLTAVGRSWAWDGPRIDGTLSCQSDDFLINLSNDEGVDKISAQAILRRDQTYDVESTVQTQNVRLSNALLSFGFKVQGQQGFFKYQKSSEKFQVQD